MQQQLGLFEDDGKTVSRNAVCAALRKGDFCAAELALAQFDRDWSDDSFVNCSNAMISAKGFPKNVDTAKSLSEIMAHVDGVVVPASVRVLNGDGLLWVRQNAWKPIALAAECLPYDAVAHAETHAAVAWMRAEEWDAAITDLIDSLRLMEPVSYRGMQTQPNAYRCFCRGSEESIHVTKYVQCPRWGVLYGCRKNNCREIAEGRPIGDSYRGLGSVH